MVELPPSPSEHTSLPAHLKANEEASQYWLASETPTRTSSYFAPIVTPKWTLTPISIQVLSFGDGRRNTEFGFGVE
jgi:hypothetical protein